MTFELSQAAWLSVVGALYDIAGAYLLAKALFAVKDKELIMQASSGFGGFSTPLLRMFCEQKVDSRFGLSLLVGGFILQALSSAGLKLTSQYAAMLLLPGVGTLAWYKLRGKTIAQKLAHDALKIQFDVAESQRLITQTFDK